MNNKTKIIKATANNLPELNDLFCQLAKFNSKYFTITKERLKDRTKDVRKALDNPKGIIYIAKQQEENIGYIYAYEINNPPQVMIEHLFVNENYRGLGIGNELIGSVEDWAKSKGQKTVELEVFDWNKEAVEFYKKEGFQKDSILMTKEIE